MAIKYKAKPKVSFVLGTTIGMVICLLMWIAVSAIITTLVLNETFKIQSLGWLTQVMKGAIGFLGALISGAIVNDKKHLSSIICSSMYLVIMICFTLLFADGLFQNFWLGVISIVTGSIAAALLNMRNRGVNQSKRNRNRFR